MSGPLNPALLSASAAICGSLVGALGSAIVRIPTAGLLRVASPRSLGTLAENPFAHVRGAMI